MFVHTSDEDTDSGVEEVTEKKYSTESKTLRDAVKTNFNVRKAATGIPRMEGHMRVRHRWHMRMQMLRQIRLKGNVMLLCHRTSKKLLDV